MAGVLGLDISRVRIEQGDTATSPYGWGTSGSRSIAQGGSASFAAAEKVAEKAAKIAGHILEASAEDIVLTEGKAVVKGTDVSVSWEEIVTAAISGNVPEDLTPGLDEEVHLRSGGLNYPFGMHLAVVEIDPESGTPRLDRMWAVDDAGVIVNPDRVRSQMEGAAVMAVGLARTGEITAANGRIRQSNFHDFQVARMGDAPYQVNVHFVDSDALPTGVGEPGLPPVLAAFGNAIHAATGRRVREFPLSRQKLV